MSRACARRERGGPAATTTTSRSAFEDETAPAGGMVQMKVETTRRHTDLGRPSVFALRRGHVRGCRRHRRCSPMNGEAAGAAVIDGNHVADRVRDDGAVHGRRDPILTVSLRIRTDAAVGSRTQFTLESVVALDRRRESSAARVSPGTVTVGGSVAITDVSSRRRLVPGWNGGVGPRHRIQQPLAAEASMISMPLNVRLVSSTEMRFTLRRDDQHDRTADPGRQSRRIEEPRSTRTCAASPPRRAAGPCSRRPSRSFPARARSVADVRPDTRHGRDAVRGTGAPESRISPAPP